MGPDDDTFSWPRAIGWSARAWLALGLALLIDARAPGGSAWRAVAAPVVCLFLAGVRERQWW
ncbi:MAG: hypothetical protein KC442_23530 [Thermomicrobiales bacterium]|nr:hypothetical protein [Thermomicrobiales bacterium]